MSTKNEEHIIQEAKKIAHSLGKMFAPFCEVVLHDLRTPQKAILVIENNFSGRSVGDATTNLGLERAVNPNFPEVLQNYQNVLPNGKTVKSTSIGIKNEQGKYIASICLNFDTTLFNQISDQLQIFASTQPASQSTKEQLRALSLQEIQEAVSAFSMKYQTTPQNLNKEQKLELIQLLDSKGLLRLRNAIANLARILGVTRPTIYSYLKTKES